MGSTRRTYRVVSCRDVTSQVEFGLKHRNEIHGLGLGLEDHVLGLGFGLMTLVFVINTG